jgi:beta-phosphoglucomutase
MQYDGYIFDMDGTMIDNMMVHHEAWQIMLGELGLHLSMEEVRLTIHGKNDEILKRLFGDRFSAEERKMHAYTKEKRYREVFKDRIKLIDGLEAFLNQAKAKGIPMAIGSAAPAENVDFVLDALDLRQYFGAIYHADMVSRGKPHPEVFLRAAEAIGLSAAQCLVFEDSPVGVRTALNAGCKVIVITTTHTRDEFDEFDHIIKFIDDYTDLDLPSL